MKGNLKTTAVWALIVVLCLAMVGCSLKTQDVVILRLGAIEVAAAVVAAASPSPEVAAVLQIVTSAIPTCIQVYQSNEPLTQKIAGITGALGQAVSASGQLDTKGQAVLKATVGAIQVLLTELQAMQTAPMQANAATGAQWEGWKIATVQGNVELRTDPLTAQELGYLTAIAKKNEGLRKKLAQAH